MDALVQFAPIQFQPGFAGAARTNGMFLLPHILIHADQVRGMELGASEYMVKSELKIENLVTKVKRYLTEEKPLG